MCKFRNNLPEKSKYKVPEANNSLKAHVEKSDFFNKYQSVQLV